MFRKIKLSLLTFFMVILSSCAECRTNTPLIAKLPADVTILSGVTHSDVPPEPKREEKKSYSQTCSTSQTKTYEDRSMITNQSTANYAVSYSGELQDNGTYAIDGYTLAALGSAWGDVGDKFEVILSDGKVLKLIKGDEKDDRDTNNGCEHIEDGSVIEFIIDTKQAMSYYGTISNGLVLNGNFNNHPDFSGELVEYRKVE